MTVAELINILKGLPPAALVVMSKDAEGNGFSPLADVEHALYVADSTWSGELSSEEGDPCVALWPTN